MNYAHAPWLSGKLRRMKMHLISSPPLSHDAFYYLDTCFLRWQEREGDGEMGRIYNLEV
jgi:hypothetical protein